MRLLIQHASRYRYPEPAALGPHTIRLRPANHTKATIETYGLRIEQPCSVRWQQDPNGNHVARVTFEEEQRVDRFDVLVELGVDIRPVNPFDFFIDDAARTFPFQYPPALARDLAAFLDREDPTCQGGPLFYEFLSKLPTQGDTVPLVVELNRLVNRRIKYVVRGESGIWTPEETLAHGRGSCRDSAVLLMAVLRSMGLAARFVSGYLIQLTDEGMIPDQPKGVGRDVVDLHAWVEVYLPGGGWVGLDATSGLLCGEGHIPLVCTAFPPLASPIDGTSDVAAADVGFSMTVGRLGHEPRPTMPYEERVWQELVLAGERADARVEGLGLSLTMGGEPTFNSRDEADLPDWNTEALGPTKWERGRLLARELIKRLAPGAALLHRYGKLYPGESLPRWALEICGRADGKPIWTNWSGPSGLPPFSGGPSLDDAHRIAGAIAMHLGLSEFLQEAYEDPWRFITDEENLPIDVDPLKADLESPEERRRLARILGRNLGAPAGFILPLARSWNGGWESERWGFRRGHVFLSPGDSPIGLRLPLKSLGPGRPLTVWEEPYFPPDPRLVTPEEEKQKAIESRSFSTSANPNAIRTALTVEPRNDALYVFLPPLPTADDFFDLVALIDGVRRKAGIDVLLEGYPPPHSPKVKRFSVTPDPGVIEVNIPPTSNTPAYVAQLEQVFDAALHAGLHAEKYLVDGRQAGSGGGNHITFGGPSPLASPFVRRPDLLASLITFAQHHPSLSYMFTGLFVGPTSQAPRIDEARQDALDEMEIALRAAFETHRGNSLGAAFGSFSSPPPWLADILFRHLLVDVSGNTHRAEISIDKLFSPDGVHGRQGLVELRAFEMPPHVRMASAQMILLRSLLAAFGSQPYEAKLARYGKLLHDKFLLPHWLWRDFENVLEFLRARDLPLPEDGYRPFLELRCPVVGEVQAGDVHLQIRNAIEPWNVLGEEATATGTSRYVDSSVERIEVMASGLLRERHRILVNGQLLPMTPTGTTGEYVAGVRFRAWAPPHSLHPHIGLHHPLRIDVLDTWGQRSLGAAAYHVWHPEGRGYDKPPLTRFEAAARRAQRFTVEAPMPWPIRPIPGSPHPDTPHTLDLRRYAVDRPPPEPEDEER